MNTMREKQVEEAVLRMDLMNIHEDVIIMFQKSGDITLSENGKDVYKRQIDDSVWNIVRDTLRATQETNPPDSSGKNQKGEMCIRDSPGSYAGLDDCIILSTAFDCLRH